MRSERELELKQCKVGSKRYTGEELEHNNLRLNFLILWHRKIHFPHGGKHNHKKKTYRTKENFLKTNFEVALPTVLSSSSSRKRRRPHTSQHVAIVHASRPHMRQKRSRGSVKLTQLWTNFPQFRHPGRLLPAWCEGRHTICLIRAGGGNPAHASCWCPGAVIARLVGDGVAPQVGGGLGCSERGGERDWGLDGLSLGGLNPQLLRETRPTDSTGVKLPRSAAFPGRRRISCWRRSRHPARPINRAGSPWDVGLSSWLLILI